MKHFSLNRRKPDHGAADAVPDDGHAATANSRNDNDLSPAALAQLSGLRPVTPFEQDQGAIMMVTSLVLAITAITSGTATYVGIHLFTEEVAGSTVQGKGMAVMLSLAIVSILTVSWGLICRYAPDAPTNRLRKFMIGLGAALFALTLMVSSLSNLVGLIGGAAKVFDWKLSHAAAISMMDTLTLQAREAEGTILSWEIAENRACAQTDLELNSGGLSGTGRGAGPVSGALVGVCAATKGARERIEQNIAITNGAVKAGRDALDMMMVAIRSRDHAIIAREDAFLIAAAEVNAQLQTLRAADLSRSLKDGAAQVVASVPALGENSAFSAKQRESLQMIRQSLGGLDEAVSSAAARIAENSVQMRFEVRSPDYVEAVMSHSPRYLPVFAAAIGIDAALLWILGFLITGRAFGPAIRAARHGDEAANTI